MPDVNLKWEGEQLTTDDDQTSNVLLSRQVAHEYHAPAVQALIQADKVAQQVAKQAVMTEMDEFRKEQSKKQAEGKAAASSYVDMLMDRKTPPATSPEPVKPANSKNEQLISESTGLFREQTAKGEKLISDETALRTADVKRNEQLISETTGKKREGIAPELGGIENPMIDPTQAAAAGAGAAFSLSRAAGMALVPSFTKAALAGLINAATDPIYGTAAEVMGASHPSLALPFNIAVGLLGGMTIEPAIERGIVKAASAAGRKLDVAGIAEQVQMMKGILANESGMVEAWHGSPHKFDKVSHDKIGTGEGEQAFGWGTYYTDKKDIAAHYAKADPYLIQPPRRTFLGNELEQNTPEYHAGTLLETTGKTLAGVKKEVAGWIENAKLGEDVEHYTKVLETLNKATSKKDFGVLPPAENVYRAQLFPGKDPSEYTFLDWYDTVGSNDKIKNLIEKSKGENWYQRLKDNQLGGPINDQVTVRDLYKHLSKELGGDKEASAFLKRAGIDGIRYPTETLSGKGNIEYKIGQYKGRWEIQTNGGEAFESGFKTKVEAEKRLAEIKEKTPHNYVVFDDKDVKLVSRESGGVVDDLTKQAVVDEVNSEIKKISVADILKSQKGEVVIRQGAEPAPTGSGVPAVSGMGKKLEEFQARPAPDITGEFAPGSNVRLRGVSDLKPKWMGPLDEGEDINRTLARMTETFEPQITESTRGVVSHAQTILESQGVTREEVLGRSHGTVLNAAQTNKLGDSVVEGLYALTEMQKVANKGLASPVDQLEIADTFNQTYMALMQYVGNAAELGRAVEIHKKIKRATGLNAGEIKDFLQGLHGLSPEELSKRLSDMDSLGKMATFVKQGNRATTINMWNESYINGMLWLPTTHMANITSNTLTDVMSVGERYTAAAISQSPIGSGQITFNEAQAYAYGMMQGTKDAWRVFADVVKTGKPSDTMSKLDLSGVGEKSITADNVAFNIDKAKRSIAKLAGRDIDKTIPPMEFEKGSPLKIGIDAIGEAIRTPGRFLLAEDDAFKTLSYRAELHALSHRKAYMEFSGNVDAAKTDLTKRGIDFASMNDEKIVRTAMSNRIAEIIDDPQKYATEVSVGAKENARYLTYTSPITNRVVNAIRASQNPLLKMLIPFTGTPYNIFRYTTERTPLFGFALQSMRDDLNAGGARKDLTLAKQAIGTMVWGAAVGMVAASGEDSPVKVYGYGPREPNRRKAWLRDGHKPYSFEFGGVTVEYGRMEPFASIFGIAVDGCEIMGMSSEKLAPKTDKIFPAFMAATAQGYLSKTFLAGISGGVKAFYEADANKMQQLINSWGKAAVPFSSALRGIEQVVSPQRKAVDGLFDAIASEIPGLSDKLPLQRDLWGRTMSKEIEKDESYLQTAIRATSPIYVSIRQDSPIDKELYQNFKEGIPMPRHEQNFLGQFENSPHNSSIKSVPYEMNPKQYEQFQKFMNETPLPSTDMTLKKSLDHMVKHDEGYKNEKDRDKKFDMIRTKVKEAIKIARAKMYETDADIQEVVDTLQQEAITNR